MAGSLVVFAFGTGFGLVGLLVIAVVVVVVLKVVF
jgi:hypothetical protein